jgi:nucleoside-diphosphate-sugar epimerase
VSCTPRVPRRAHVAQRAARPPHPAPAQAAVVVTGANGLLGRALVQRLLEHGERVRLFVRREPPPELREHPSVDVVLGDLGDPAAVARGLANATTVFHCGAAMFGPWAAHASGTVEGTRNVLASCQAHGVKKLVYVSSLSVLHTSALSGRPVTESSPLEPRPEERGAYSRAKCQAEGLVRAAAAERQLHVVILRPGHIWTERGPLLSPAVGMHVGRLLLMLGDPSLLLPLVHVDDVVTALLLARDADVAPGSVFHLVDDDPIPREELARLYRDAREPDLRIVRIPLAVATTVAGLLGGLTRALGRPMGPSPYRLRAGVTSLRFDCTKAFRELGWRPRVSSRTVLHTLLTRRG